MRYRQGELALDGLLRDSIRALVRAVASDYIKLIHALLFQALYDLLEVLVRGISSRRP